MPRTKEQFESMRKATKEKILSAAIKLFAKKGFAATSVNDIAEEAEISIGLMYRHYKKKEDLFNELITFAAEGLEQMTNRFKQDASPLELMRQFTLDIIKDLEKDDEFANFLMIMYQASTMSNPSSLIQYLNEQSEAMLKQTAILIENGQELGQFKKGNAREMSLYFFASIQGLAMMKLSMNEAFITPGLDVLTGFLLKDGYILTK
ncbi:TetR/AcrR family transcriptional regulator [Bacillus tuaregi]|uniref:TetR/AcrR family transcriptional regulator n=1 Tax=Bacillus tuaregi TaxID=1816695 RepID=UPI0008F8D602|nr:TetR/AcrR family transcriptional regulator [Bacillus tuaregi]